jgi:hypothetical protein
MSDHKWDRFKRSFGVNPSNDLITGRDNKISAAIVTVDQQIARLVTAGLPPGGLQRQRNDIDRSRTDALGLKTPKEKYAALDPVKDLARKLATDAPGLVDTQINTLTGDLARVRGEIKTAVDDAEGIKNPLCQTAVATALKAVKDAAVIAEGKPNDTAKRDALDDIDLGPLQLVQAQAKPADTQVFYLTSRCKWATENIGRLPDGKPKTEFADKIKVYTDELADLANETDLARLLSRAKTAADNMNKLVIVPLKLQIGEWEGLKDARANVALVVDQAKAIRCDVGKLAIKTQLDLVEKEVAKAEKLPTYNDIAEALRAKPLQKLLLDLSRAVASARNIDAGVPKLLAGLDAAIKKLPDGTAKTDFEKERVKLQSAATSLETGTVLDTVQKGYAKLRLAGDELMGRVLKASGEAGYEDAIMARFGVAVSMGKEGVKLNLEGAYSTLEAVPEGHIGHDKLKLITFTGKPDKGGAYGSASITIDHFEKTDPYFYDIDGKQQKVNGFNVCMLHEIGHAVDDKYKVMAGVMSTAGAGQWKSEKTADVLKALTDAANVELGNAAAEVKNFAKKMIDDGLSSKDTEKPKNVTISRSQWKTMQKYTSIAKAINAKSEPWFNGEAASLAIGDRVYTDSGGQGWYSYALSERQSGSVRNYQWRSPAEWFAEIYGLSWLTKKKVVSGVTADVATWLPP